MPLEDYRRKRDFRRSPEPAGAKPPRRKRAGRSGTPALCYAIQKHAARNLHYDLRLELDGVLLSWALPKGPSLDPTEKRLAVQVEDHPLEYAGFEGVIPAGEYGGGTVMVWDQGAWSPLSEPRAALADGKLKFTIDGHKLRGGFTLVRMKDDDAARRRGGGRNWLLIKERDEHARSAKAERITDSAPYSALSNRSMPEIAAASDRVWSSHGGELPTPKKRRQAADRRSGVTRRHITIDPRLTPGALHGARRRALPASFSPAEPVDAETVPDGDEWLHELWPRGRRVLATLSTDALTLRDEHDVELAPRVPPIAAALAALPVESATVDGLLVALDARGLGDAAALDAALDGPAATTPPAGRTLALLTLDLPACGGYDLRRVALRDRKALLRAMIHPDHPANAALRVCDEIVGNGAAVSAHARRLGVPTLVSRKVDGAYPTRRSRVWQRVALNAADEATAAPTRPPAIVAEPSLEIAGVRISNPQRVLYPEEQVTKEMLVRYYDALAERMLPFVADRPLSLYRCPDGIEADGFFQKHLRDFSTPHLREAPLRERESKRPYIVLDSAAGLVTLGQLAVLEVHTWGCKADRIDRPDQLILDLDPGPGVEWPQIAAAALRVREILNEAGLASFVKTSGGKGLHIVAPLVRRSGWDEVKNAAKAIARRLAKEEPKRYTATVAAWAREGRVYLDALRNTRGATCVAAYSPRARPGAAVSTPLDWSELQVSTPPVFTLRTLPHRLAGLAEDPWAEFWEVRQSLTRDALETLSRAT